MPPFLNCSYKQQKSKPLTQKLNQQFNDSSPLSLYNHFRNSKGVMYMNLKEAFRYQNKLQRLMTEAESILRRDQNVTRVENTALRRKVNPDAENETTLETPETEYAEQITDITMFLMFLMQERERLSAAIRAAKQTMEMDFDGETSLNAHRQEIAAIFRHMAEIRCSETLYSGAGVGYKFNAEGNQVSYRCDLKKVTTINFDRNKVRSYASALSKRADQVSAELDKCMVITEVAYDAPFDVNDSFAEILRQFTEINS